MKIAITAQGPQPDSLVDPRFGRAKHFVLFDTETDELSSIDNQVNLQSAQGAGIQSGRTVVDAGAKAVLTGHVGPKAFATLQAGDVVVYTGIEGTVAEAIEQYKAGLLTPANDANVDGHWA
jgi:predicted Fe-Mo cluster-binding NifX family protein